MDLAAPRPVRSDQPRMEAVSSALAGGVCTAEPLRVPHGGFPEETLELEGLKG